MSTRKLVCVSNQLPVLYDVGILLYLYIINTLIFNAIYMGKV